MKKKNLIAAFTAAALTIGCLAPIPVSRAQETSNISSDRIDVSKPLVEAGTLLSKIAGYDAEISSADGGAAEIVQYNSENNKFYVVSGLKKSVDIVSLDDVNSTGKPATAVKQLSKSASIDVESLIDQTGLDFTYGDITSVAVSTELDAIALAVQEADYTKNGLVILTDYDGAYLASYFTGVQPDMVTFSPDGKTAYTADEGEPRNGYGEGAIDPAGTVTAIDLSAGIEKGVVIPIDFTKYDTEKERTRLTEAGVIIKKNTAPSQDFEPEYIALSEDGKKAYVALQEANAIAVIDTTSQTVDSVHALGFKDHSKKGNELDLLKDKEIAIENQDVFGIYMPDGICTYSIGNKTYLVTANEGDSREWGSGDCEYLNEVEIETAGCEIVTFKASDYDGVDENKTYIFGGRSFAIWDTADMSLVYESGNSLEALTASIYPDYFNCSNDKVKLDNRSGKKGPEPESVQVAAINDKIYAFIGIERIGGVAVYDITDLSDVKPYDYINTRDFSEDIAGDDSVEGMCYIPSQKDVNEYPLLLAANEVSGTVACYQLSEKEAEKPDASPTPAVPTPAAPTPAVPTPDTPTNTPAITPSPVPADTITPKPASTATPEVRQTVKKVTIKKLENKKKQTLKVTWKKVTNAKKYQIAFSTDKNFKKRVHTKTIAASKTSYTIKNLKKGTRYFVHIRAKGSTGYGSWSTSKKILIKK